jgi:hypothetical protein
VLVGATRMQHPAWPGESPPGPPRARLQSTRRLPAEHAAPHSGGGGHHGRDRKRVPRRDEKRLSCERRCPHTTSMTQSLLPISGVARFPRIRLQHAGSQLRRTVVSHTPRTRAAERSPATASRGTAACPCFEAKGRGGIGREGRVERECQRGAVIPATYHSAVVVRPRGGGASSGHGELIPNSPTRH